MFPIRFRIRASCAIVLLGLCGTPAILARVPAADSNGPALAMQLVRTGLFMISGAGGNSLVRLTPSGPVVVDANLAGTHEVFQKKIRRIAEDPVRFLITTQGDEDHAGTDADFAAAGAQIIVHENAWRELSQRNPGIDEKIPAITYEREYTLRLGGIEARLMHFGRARTDGDTVVYFPNLKVVAVGDLYAAYPDPDFSSGGSLVHWGAVLGELLKLDFDVAVPSHGPAVDRAAVETLKAKTEALVARASVLAKAGVPKDQLMTRLEADIGWRLPFEGRQLDGFYAEISASSMAEPAP